MESKIFIILGKRGLGKTTLVKTMLVKDFADRNIIIFDLHGEYNLKGFQIVYNINDFKNYVNEIYKSGKKLKLIYVPIGNEGFYNEVFENIAGLVKNITNVLFVVEEADNFCSPYYLSANLRWLIEYGRHKNIGLICTSRRFGNISRSLTAQAHKIITFRQTEPRDIILLKEFSFNENDLKTLPDYHFIEKNI